MLISIHTNPDKHLRALVSLSPSLNTYTVTLVDTQTLVAIPQATITNILTEAQAVTEAQGLILLYDGERPNPHTPGPFPLPTLTKTTLRDGLATRTETSEADSPSDMPRL